MKIAILTVTSFCLGTATGVVGSQLPAPGSDAGGASPGRSTVAYTEELERDAARTLPRLERALLAMSGQGALWRR